ncbi:dehydrogenase/reductase SDR family member on chromosome X [Culicoides brevitarsis]|uniref:dehydrogenase/reductase SDR family member on chromosome X n=1 Tax=Culicoides brevitarsis TaxID=469753 RepID=UPI00307C9F64
MMVFFFLVAGLVATLALLYFMRTSEELPKTWPQFKTEIKFIIGGIKGCGVDIGLKHRNKIALYSQPDKVAIITGGNRGLGLYVVKKLVDCDMTVIVGVRDPVQAKSAVEKLIDESKHNKVHYERLDVGSMSSVRQFAAKVQEKFTKIHILINNAGIMNVPLKRTEDGFESQLAVNYLGHFLLTHLLLPQLKAAGTEKCCARIVNVSSCVYQLGEIKWSDINSEKSYYPADAYSQSKLAQMFFSRHLEAKLKESGAHVHSYAVHPGVVNTDLFNITGMSAIPWFRAFFFKTPEQGSRTVVYAAIHPKLEGRGGGYYSNCLPFPQKNGVKDPARCERLFNLSCELLRIKDFGGI